MSLDVPGIYVFWRGSLCIYVGITNNLRRRLLKHYSDSHNPMLRCWIDSAYELHLEYLEVRLREHQLIRERTVISKFDPVCNIAGKN